MQECKSALITYQFLIGTLKKSSNQYETNIPQHMFYYLHVFMLWYPINWTVSWGWGSKKNMSSSKHRKGIGVLFSNQIFQAEERISTKRDNQEQHAVYLRSSNECSLTEPFTSGQQLCVIGPTKMSQIRISIYKLQYHIYLINFYYKRYIYFNVFIIVCLSFCLLVQLVVFIV